MILFFVREIFQKIKCAIEEPCKGSITGKADWFIGKEWESRSFWSFAKVVTLFRTDWSV